MPAGGTHSPCLGRQCVSLRRPSALEDDIRCSNRLRRPVGGRRVTSTRVKTRFFTFSRVATSCMSAASVGRFPLAPQRSCPEAFHIAFVTWRRRTAVCCALSLLADYRSTSWPLRNVLRLL